MLGKVPVGREGYHQRCSAPVESWPDDPEVWVEMLALSTSYVRSPMDPSAVKDHLIQWATGENSQPSWNPLLSLEVFTKRYGLDGCGKRTFKNIGIECGLGVANVRRRLLRVERIMRSPVGG